MTARLPPEAERAPVHAPAPSEAVEAAHEAAFAALQVRVVGCPTVTVAGDAERVTVGAGKFENAVMLVVAMADPLVLEQLI